MLLTGGDLSAHDLGDWALGWSDAVRFAELDPLGHVNNVAYLAWYEALRVRHLIHAGLTRYGPNDPQFVVVALDAAYRAEMRLHDTYVVATRCARLGRTSFVMAYTCRRDGKETASGSATVVMLRDGAPAPLAAGQRVALEGAD